jgi:aerobic-type carbon monoxide dehydrogenase small subunit (CoxS/CutS family)
MATQLLDEHPAPTDNQIKHYLSGICTGMRRAPRSSMKLAAQKRKARGAHRCDI